MRSENNKDKTFIKDSEKNMRNVETRPLSEIATNIPYGQHSEIPLSMRLLQSSALLCTRTHKRRTNPRPIFSCDI